MTDAEEALKSIEGRVEKVDVTVRADAEAAAEAHAHFLMIASGTVPPRDGSYFDRKSS